MNENKNLILAVVLSALVLLGWSFLSDKFVPANPPPVKVEDGKVKLEPSLMIVDGLGILRAEYRRGIPPVEIALRDIDLLLTESRNSTGLTKYAYEAAHLFLCYP